ncbi:redox-regulated ATPase YchF [Patescibacteria group bacterium]|nr:redox-regulated ATPase YchF [Patescibacteria group bacterium]
MALSIGIVGLPNVGKSTLFNTITKNQVSASNYPFCTIDPNVGVVTVPDERLEKLSAISGSAKLLPTTIEFVDIAGLVKGAHKGEGLGNKFLAHIRECDAICEVVRAFEDDNIIHVDGRIDPKEDRQTINIELIMADLSTVEKAIERKTREAKSGDKDALKHKDLFVKLKENLDGEKAAREFECNEEDEKVIAQLQLITKKPIIYVINDNKGNSLDSSGWDGLVITLNVQLESEIASLPKEDQAEFIKELGLDESGLDKLIKASYELLGLSTFLTTGKIETRAWTVKKGSKAPVAAAAIHSDFEKNFIRVEIVKWQDFVACNGEAVAREKGLLRTEGKEYIVQDGDVCHFLVNK